MALVAPRSVAAPPIRPALPWSSLEFGVRGLPAAQGSARAFIAGGRAIITTEANRPRSPLGAWRTAIATEARRVIGDAPLATGPVTVTVHFVFPRPANHFLPANRKRPEPELRLDAPRFVTSHAAGDIDKLGRSLLDALTHVVIADDSLVAGLMAWKQYEDDDRRPGAVIRIVRLGETL
jgi:Holliday junction resolvase RusA-like endonuclease